VELAEALRRSAVLFVVAVAAAAAASYLFSGSTDGGSVDWGLSLVLGGAISLANLLVSWWKQRSHR